jgi:uncharacterized LabA/DUF88 family protein
VERISGHAIDRRHIDELRPIPVRIRFYIDGYGAKKTTEALYEIGLVKVDEHIESQPEMNTTFAAALKKQLKHPKTPGVLAEILGSCLGLIELHVISDIEKRMEASGRPMFPNALLVNQSNPHNISLNNNKQHNTLEALYPASESQIASNEYLDVGCDGVIFCPKKINKEKETSALNRELNDIRAHNDTSRSLWLKSNIKAIQEGAFFYRRRDGNIGERINFEFTEKFFEEVSDRIGYYSRLGEHKVHWRQDLNSFGENGVDCDLIMQVMDDLYRNEVDVFVLMTNDMDFFPLIERLREEGKYVYICGLRRNVSNRLTDALSDNAFFDMSREAIINNICSVFMTVEKPEMRALALQWTWLAIQRESEIKS